ncbi:MAG: glycosyltransferase [Flavobacteriales bacterium]|nr:glycosyltransferase [Flavobacteriales bacterium]
MKVSLITVAYNSAATIADTIQSIAAQDHPDIEYIIIDGGSTDGTMDLVKNAKSVTKYLSEPDRGLYDAMNKGVALCTGDIIGILNSDDVYQDGQVISDVVRMFDEQPIDCVYGDLVYVDPEDLSKVSRYWKSGEYHRKAFLNGWMPPHPTFFTRRECYKTFGAYDLQFKTSADYELMLRFMFKNHCSTAYLPRILVRMREGGQSNENLINRIRGNKEDRQAWVKNGLNPRFYTLTMKPLRKISQFWSRPGQEG